MKVKLMTDAPKHNLALMKISAWHKSQGDTVFLGTQQDNDYDLSYASILYKINRPKYYADVMGGPGYDPCVRLDDKFDLPPDYTLYPNLKTSVGYTWDRCPNDCGFCVEPKMARQGIHKSIWSFHKPEFKFITLLNPNTFSDPQWLSTINEIQQADLTIIDENGYDLRLLTERKVTALNRVKFAGPICFAWDRVEDYDKIIPNLHLLKYIRHPKMVFVLIGFDPQKPDGWRRLDRSDMFRVAMLQRHRIDAYVMVYNEVKHSKMPIMQDLMRFKRMINRAHLHKNGRRGVTKAWQQYKP